MRKLKRNAKIAEEAVEIDNEINSRLAAHILANAIKLDPADSSQVKEVQRTNRFVEAMLVNLGVVVLALVLLLFGLLDRGFGVVDRPRMTPDRGKDSHRYWRREWS